ncbi:MAG: M28 family peptidase, partial [Cyanobacteria bacterium J06632_3]
YLISKRKKSQTILITQLLPSENRVGKRGVYFAIAAANMIGIIWGNPINRIKAAFFPEIPVVLPTVSKSSLPTVDLSVEEEQLWRHIEAVSVPRFSNTEKEAIRRYISEQLISYGLAPVEQRYRHLETGAIDTGGVNVVVDLPGSDPSAGTYLLGAHYDTFAESPGADDNGSAIAALLETARLFSAARATQAFPGSLKIVFFDQEEQQPDGSGLVGSLAFTQNSNNLIGLQGAVILDMIGHTCTLPGCQTYPTGLPVQDLPDTGEFLAVLGLADNTELLGAFMGSARTTRPTVFTLPIPKATVPLFPDVARSDHAPFWEQNIPAVFVTDTANFRNPNYHTEQDTPETLDRTFLTGNAQHVVNVMATLITRPNAEKS